MNAGNCFKKILYLSFVFLFYVGFQNIQAQPCTISGFVIDSTNGEGLIGANVYFENQSIGISTNDQGYFVLYPISPGDYILQVAYIGYETVSQRINLSGGEKRFMNILMNPQALTGEEVIVSAEALSREREIGISKVDLSARTIRRAPQLAEADLFRTLQALPGVIAESDFSTGLVVRGGNTDQNLIMLDGITVYNPSHMGGIFSNFLLDATKDAQFIKGGYPAEYGGRMSSVLNVISKSGNNQKFSGAAGISMLSSRLSLEIPVGNGSLLLAGRRTYFDQVLKLMGEEFPYYFYDFQGSFFQDLSPYDRLTISGYFGDDVLDWDKLAFNIRWGNRTISTNWRHVFSPRLFSNFMVAASQFKTQFILGGDQGIDSRNDLIDYTAKGDLTYFISPLNSIKFGFEYKNMEFKYEDIYDDRTIFRLKQTPIEMAFYVQNDWRIHPRWIIKPGLRMSYYMRKVKNVYFEPRFSVKFRLRPGEYISYATGIYRQFIYTVKMNIIPHLLTVGLQLTKLLNRDNLYIILLVTKENYGLPPH